MDLYYSHISDEALFFKMSQGDKGAQAVLLHRFEHMGFQCMNILARKHSIRFQNDSEYIDTIDEAIYKAFRYYHPNERRFGSFCYELITQALTLRIHEFYSEYQHIGEILPLDNPISEEENIFLSDIIPDTLRLSAPEEYNLKEFILHALGEADKKTIKDLEIYELNLYGLTINEICKRYNKTVYEIRNSIKHAKQFMEEKRNDFELEQGDFYGRL